ncbi:uncharacterized protein PAC_05452 [Phialocephala subalpina]|uniref:Glutathione S-transferase n=1 Tax=Phialocephala subalpina TaxID=576137 RepID=A0A1L7WS14_9HELO|nr:uncharacterized protein PAC_05452 [Phialocephala subalpina]
MLKLISATPSPYARKVRIVLAEKGIPFELITEVPWNSMTKTPLHNPLEKLPVLILEDGSSVYESHYILEYIEAKFPEKPLLSEDIDERLFAKKVEVVADGMCDALVLSFFENQRDQPSEEWKTRPMRKVDGGFEALAEWVGDKHFIVGGKFGLADVAAGSVCGYCDVRFAEYPWRKTYPKLAKYVDKLAARQSFKDTVPAGQKISDKIGYRSVGSSVVRVDSNDYLLTAHHRFRRAFVERDLRPSEADLEWESSVPSSPLPSDTTASEITTVANPSIPGQMSFREWRYGPFCEPDSKWRVFDEGDSIISPRAALGIRLTAPEHWEVVPQGMMASGKYYNGVEEEMDGRAGRINWPKRIQRPATFRLFGDLPTELRLKIWKYTLPKPRVVQFSMEGQQVNNAPQYDIPPRDFIYGKGPPGAQHLFTCHESSLVFKEHYHRIKISNTEEVQDTEPDHYTQWIDGARDTLVISMRVFSNLTLSAHGSISLEFRILDCLKWIPSMNHSPHGLSLKQNLEVGWMETYTWASASEEEIIPCILAATEVHDRFNRLIEEGNDHLKGFDYQVSLLAAEYTKSNIGNWWRGGALYSQYDGIKELFEEGEMYNDGGPKDISPYYRDDFDYDGDEYYGVEFAVPEDLGF